MGVGRKAIPPPELAMAVMGKLVIFLAFALIVHAGVSMIQCERTAPGGQGAVSLSPRH